MSRVSDLCCPYPAGPGWATQTWADTTSHRCPTKLWTMLQVHSNCLLCFALLCFPLLCFALLCFALLCFALLCFALLCFALLCFALLCFESASCSLRAALTALHTLIVLAAPMQRCHRYSLWKLNSRQLSDLVLLDVQALRLSSVQRALWRLPRTRCEF